MASASLGALIPVARRSVPIVHVQRVENAEALTVGELCAQFLDSKRMLLSSNELAPRTVERYEADCRRVLDAFGEYRKVESLTPLDFERLRAAMAGRWGPATLADFVQSVRTIFKYGYDACLVDRPMRFGPSFKKPKLRTMRRARRERGSMMFEAEEIRALLAIARPSVQAMIMLGVNCGFGTADVGTLPKSAIDLKSGWVNYPRPKTEMDRRCPLWPETVGAIERASVLRPTPRLSEYADLVFLTPRGGQWANGRQAKSALSHDIRRLVRSAGSDAGNGRGFYALRRTFETIGSEALDQAAVDLIMGHCPRADDMPARYRQRVGDDRLIAVTEHVRLWLFPTARDNHFQQCRERAGGILAEWNGVERLSPQDISAAIKSLRISQTELARGIGLNLQTVNAALCCRKPLSAEVVFRIRRFFQQVADGVGRTPIVSPAPTSAWAAPTAPIPGAIPASPEIEKLFDGRPFTVADFVIVQRYLRDNFGIKNRTLSIWLGYKKRDHLSKIVWRQSKINFASRLRKLFVFAQEGGAT